MSACFFYTIFYFLMSGCIIYPPTEFVSAGLTIKGIFANWLGSESDSFIQYHIRRSVATLFVHSMLPFGYVLGLILFGHVDATRVFTGQEHPMWLLLIVAVTAGPIYVVYKILDWSIHNCDTHPIARNVAVYCNNNTTWSNVAFNINAECKRIDKIVIDTNSITRVIATDNWIIKVTPYKVQVAHQSDTALVVNRSDTHVISPAARGEVQFINIEVKPTRTGSESFDIRLNVLDFKDFQDRVSRPITILQNVKFHKTLLDRFIDTFKEQVGKNPLYDTREELDQCIGCMQVPSDVKLTMLCGNVTGVRESTCTMCYCRPMWCIDCMAKWFASRQDETAPETWLSSTCTCPVCRARFCLLDVCLVRTLDQ